MDIWDRRPTWYLFNNVYSIQNRSVHKNTHLTLYLTHLNGQLQIVIPINFPILFIVVWFDNYRIYCTNMTPCARLQIMHKRSRAHVIIAIYVIFQSHFRLSRMCGRGHHMSRQRNRAFTCITHNINDRSQPRATESNEDKTIDKSYRKKTALFSPIQHTHTQRSKSNCGQKWNEKHQYQATNKTKYRAPLSFPFKINVRRTRFCKRTDHQPFIYYLIPIK